MLAGWRPAADRVLSGCLWRGTEWAQHCQAFPGWLRVLLLIGVSLRALPALEIPRAHSTWLPVRYLVDLLSFVYLCLFVYTSGADDGALGTPCARGKLWAVFWGGLCAAHRSCLAISCWAFIRMTAGSLAQSPGSPLVVVERNLGFAGDHRPVGGGSFGPAARRREATTAQWRFCLLRDLYCPGPT